MLVNRHMIPEAGDNVSHTSASSTLGTQHNIEIFIDTRLGIADWVSAKLFIILNFV